VESLAEVAITPDAFKCRTLQLDQYRMMEDVVRATALLSRNKNAVRRATLVTDDFTELQSETKQHYVAARVVSQGLLGVTWSEWAVLSFTIWINPTLAPQVPDGRWMPEAQMTTVIHELCHAFVANGTSHDESFRKLYHRAIYHWNVLRNDIYWDVWQAGYNTVERYTRRVVDDRRYESMDDYLSRIEGECNRAQRMAEKEHGQLRGVLYERFGWTMAELGS
jgi:hypothetical protein